MTDQRISLARLTAGGMLVLAAFGASAQDMPRNSNPNPFQRPTAITPAPTAAPTATVSAAPAAAVEQGPLTLPPPIPLPPPGIAYPALSLPKQPATTAAPASKVLPPPVPPLEDGIDAPSGKQASTSKQPTKTDEDAPAKPRAFLAREKIEANRARCQVSFKGRTLVQLPAGDTDQIIQLSGADGCLTAMSTDSDWLDVQYAGNNELIVSATANEDSASRRGQVTVVTPKQTFVLSVRQAAPAAAPIVPPTRSVVASAAPVASVVDSPLKKPAVNSDAEAAKVAEPVPAQIEPALSEAARARMTESPAGEEASPVSARLSERALKDITVSVVTLVALPKFELPELTEPLLVLPSLLTRETTIALVEPTKLPISSVLSLPLPDVKVTPSVTQAPRVVEPIKPVEVSPPKTVEYKASAQIVENEPTPQPAANPTRARSVLQAMLGVQTPAPSAVPAKTNRAPAAVSAKGKSEVKAAPAEKPVVVSAKPAATKSVAIPDGYVTLDEYDAPTSPATRK